MTWQDGHPINRKRPLSESQKRQLARVAGTFVDPPPTVATRAARFNQSFGKRPPDLALRSVTGAPIGPPKR